MKGLSFVAGPATGVVDTGYDYTSFPEVVAAATDAYQQAGITNPRASSRWPRSTTASRRPSSSSWRTSGSPSAASPGKRCSPGTFDLDGELPVNPDGGLKAFGHPIGASGLRMLFECWLQLRGEAGERQIPTVAQGKKLALTHNLGGSPGECVSYVGIVGSELDA